MGVRENAWEPRRRVASDHRMLQLLKPLPARTSIAIDEFADGIERSAPQDGAVAPGGELFGAELSDELRKHAGNLLLMRLAVSRVLPLGTGKNRAGHPVLSEFAPHVGRFVVKWTYFPSLHR